MKISFLIFLVVISFTLTTATSCNKGDEPKPEQIDSLKSVLPKDVTWVRIDNLTGKQEIFNLDMSYDTLNRKIQMYDDNSGGVNPYGKYRLTYNFNNDGYLTKLEMETDESDQNIRVIIVRETNNQVRYMIYESVGGNTRDTVSYFYTLVGDKTKIISKEKYSSQAYPLQTYDESYVFSSENRLLSSDEGLTNKDGHGIDGSWEYEYYPNNSLNKIIYYNYTNGSTAPQIATYVYDSGIPDGKEDILQRLILGKDYYIPEIKRLYIFSFVHSFLSQFNVFSATDPYHPTKVQYSNLPFAQQEEVEITYEVNEQKLLSKATYSENGKVLSTMSFMY